MPALTSGSWLLYSLPDPGDILTASVDIFPCKEARGEGNLPGYLFATQDLECGVDARRPARGIFEACREHSIADVCLSFLLQGIDADEEDALLPARSIRLCHNLLDLLRLDGPTNLGG